MEDVACQWSFNVEPPYAKFALHLKSDKLKVLCLLENSIHPISQQHYSDSNLAINILFLDVSIQLNASLFPGL